MSAEKGTPNPVALGLLRMTLDRDAEIDRLTAALDAARRETASHRHAALFAAGIHGGPGAWRWRSDPQGTILDDTEAWERLLGEMRERAGTPEPVERKPVAGWVSMREEGDTFTLSAGPFRIAAYDAESPSDRNFTIIGEERETGFGAELSTESGFESCNAMLFAAEDALRAIADQINGVLRGSQ